MKQQINALTSTRAVAAILVFIHHYGGGTFPFSKTTHIFQSGNLAVSYFFVLSGFVLLLSYYDKPLHYANYLQKRVARIVPLYLFALLSYISLPLLLHASLIPDNITRQFIYGSLFIQSYFHGFPLTLNSPAWSVSVEMLFYLLFPLLLLIQKKHVKLFTGITILAFAVTQIIHLKFYPQRETAGEIVTDFIFFNPIMHLNQFMIGMIAGLAYLKIKGRNLKLTLVPTLLFVLIMLVIAFRPDNLSYHTGLIAPLFALFIISVALSNDKWLNKRSFVFMGEISFGIYILQMPVYELLLYLNPKYAYIPKEWFCYFSLGVLILVAAACYYLIEKPMQRLINSIGKR